MICRYLKGILEVGKEAALTNDQAKGLKGSPLMPRASQEAGAQAEMQVSELFVRLLCQFEPQAVLGFLQSHETYRVQVTPPPPLSLLNLPGGKQAAWDAKQGKRHIADKDWMVVMVYRYHCLLYGASLEDILSS